MEPFTTRFIDKNGSKYINKFGLFLHPLWLHAIEEGLGYKNFGLITKIGSEPVCLSIFLKTKKGGILKLAGAPLPGCFTPYMDPVWLKDIDDYVKIKIIYEQDRFLLKNGFSYIERRFRDDCLVEKMKNNTKYEISFPETFILKVEPDIEVMWKKMQGRSRNMVRKAEKYGVRVVQGSGSISEIELFYNMLKRVFAKSNSSPPHPFSLYKSIVNYLIPQKRLLILSALLNDKVIGMGLFIHDDKEIHFLSGASLPEAYKTGANNMIQWYAIKFACENGLKIYDLGGKGIPSIDKFKASFGGEVHRYGRIVLRSKTAFIAERLYKKFILFRDKLKTKIKV